MEGMVLYTIKSSGILFILYGYYWLFLRKQTFFTINRFYLLFSLILGMTLPYISIEITHPILTTGHLYPAAYVDHFLDNANTDANNTAVQSARSKLLPAVLFILYMAGVLFFLVRYLTALGQILRLIARNPRKSVQGIHIVKLKEQQPLFSFFNYLFVHQLPASREDRRKMFEHEKKHILQKHSCDLLIAELACITNWFNPLVWLFKNAILENHEYIADQQVIRKYHTGGYPELLIRQTFKGCFSFTNYFACSKLKKRIMMMTKKQTSKVQVIRYIPALALCGILFYGLCCNISAKAAESNTPGQSPKQEIQTEKDSTVFAFTEVAPKFLEDNGNPYQWIQKNLKYPVRILQKDKNEKIGKVFVNFIIDEEGNVTSPKIIKGIQPRIDAKVLKVIQKMPKWQPGIQRGKPVKVSFNIAVPLLLSKNGTPYQIKAPDKVTVTTLKNK